MRRTCLPVAVIVLVLGCGSGSTGSVDGTVALNGEPLGKGYISFTPTSGDGGTAGAEVLAGKYRVENLKPGRYQVHIAGQPDGPVIMPGSKEAKKKLSEQEIRAMIDPLPANATGNGQKIEVLAGEQTRDFKLESKSNPASRP